MAGSVRITPGTNRRLRIFATTQIACSFVLLAGAGMLLATLVSLQTANTGYDMRHVLAFDIPPSATGVVGAKTLTFYQETIRRIAQMPGVERAAFGSFVPWRDAGGQSSLNMRFTVEGYTPANGEENPRARFRIVSPDSSRRSASRSSPAATSRTKTAWAAKMSSIVSQTVAQRLFPNGDAVNRHLFITEPYFGPKPIPRRIVGVVADVDDENVVRGTAMAMYQPVAQIGLAGRLFVRTAGDPYSLVPSVTRVIRELAADQPVERAATLEDVRAQVLSPDRLKAFVISGFAGIALLIAVVGVAGVLAFSVSARTREFGVRLAIGSAPRQLLARVLSEGAQIAVVGVAAGAVGGYALARLASRFFGGVEMPGLVAVTAAAAVLIAAAVIASLMPAARASRVDVLQALRSE